MASPKVIDPSGSPIPLGKLLGQGGEGAVYEIVNAPAMVAKVYHKPLDADRADKIRAMIPMVSDRLAKLTAWPRGLLLDSQRRPVGLAMDKVPGRRDIHELYGPKSRRTHFQRANWAFLIRAAANVARAFNVVHDAGCVIGDVNHGSILVGQDATVRLIDCDSMQVTTGGRTYFCEVGVETFTPPDLQGKSFKGIVRTTNHDNFGLAVMIFLMLFMGRHPFAGRYLGRGDMPIAKAIEEHRFAYGSTSKQREMERPPRTPDLAIVGPQVAGLFERAFAHTSVHGGRPVAREWVSALEVLEKQLKTCQRSSAHLHLSGIPCPWCEMESKTGVSLFPSFIEAGLGSTFDLDQLWRQVERLPALGAAPDLPLPPLPPAMPEAIEHRESLSQDIWFRAIGAVMLAGFIVLATQATNVKGIQALGILGAIVAFFSVIGSKREGAVDPKWQNALTQAKANYDRGMAEWRSRADGSKVETQRQQLETLRYQLTQLPTRRLSELDRLKREQRRLQLENYLDTFEIEKAQIKDVGRGRKQILGSYGIETAADVNGPAVSAVPGFGPKLVERMLAWRRELELKFKFDASKPISPADIAKVEQEILTERTRLESAIRSGIAQLINSHRQVLEARSTLRPAIERAGAVLRQAQADRTAAHP